MKTESTIPEASERKLVGRLTYAQISRALTRDVYRIFHVNMKTGSYVEYIPHLDDQALDVEKDGTDFFHDLKAEFLQQIYTDDRDLFLTAMTPENLNRVLSSDDTFALNIRVLIDGKAIYSRLKGTCVYDSDPSSVIFGLSNIDANMQRLAEYENLEKERLTYADISEALAEDYFCIYYVDTQTDHFTVYNAGEEYLSAGLRLSGSDFFHNGTKFSELICSYFKHSPVYRIGGDEFVVIPNGTDYDELEDKLTQINQIIEQNRETGKVVIAIGKAEFDASEDKAVNDVFERADAAMYARKKQLKEKA